jgi:hypothetical protein
MGYKRWGVNPAYAVVDNKIIAGAYYSKNIGTLFNAKPVA